MKDDLWSLTHGRVRKNQGDILIYSQLMKEHWVDIWSLMCELCVDMIVTQSFLTLWDPMDCSLPVCSVLGILQARILEWIAIPSSRGSSQPRDWTQVSCIAGRFFLLSEPQGKPKNTGVGSLSFIQGDIPTQESNQGFLHCRQILYQLSHQGSPPPMTQEDFLCLLCFFLHSVIYP